MQQIDKNTFFKITQNFDYVPFTQSEGWWAMHSIKGENRFMFFVDNLENPQMACMGRTMRKFWLKMLQIEGECLLNEKNIDSKKIREFYKEITQTNFDIIETNSSLPYNALYEIGIREAGYLRPVGMFSTQLSSYIYLQQEIHYDRNWSRNLEKSTKSDLEFEIVGKPDEKDCIDFCCIYNAMNSRKNLSSQISKNQINRLLTDNNYQLFFVKQTNKQIASIIIYRKNKFAEGIYAGSMSEALNVSATFFMYRQLFQYLKNQQYEIYDMAKLSPSTHSKQSVFLFKNGVKGEYIQYCGEWAICKKQIYRPLMYFLKKYLFKIIEV
ncbi:MAG: hypothetical protein FWD66_05535 [Paludibacter sp.]|nr:hypothetical protein [Paludibacter sp.]